jgi:hypothetical protein
VPAADLFAYGVPRQRGGRGSETEWAESTAPAEGPFHFFCLGSELSGMSLGKKLAQDDRAGAPVRLYGFRSAFRDPGHGESRSQMFGAQRRTLRSRNRNAESTWRRRFGRAGRFAPAVSTRRALRACSVRSRSITLPIRVELLRPPRSPRIRLRNTVRHRVRRRPSSRPAPVVRHECSATCRERLKSASEGATVPKGDRAYLGRVRRSEKGVAISKRCASNSIDLVWTTFEPASAVEVA